MYLDLLYSTYLKRVRFNYAAIQEPHELNQIVKGENICVLYRENELWQLEEDAVGSPHPSDFLRNACPWPVSRRKVAPRSIHEEFLN